MIDTQRGFDLKSRRLIAFGCACLSVGLALRILIHASTPGTQILLQMVTGFLIGLSLGLNLFAFRLVRRCRPKGA